MIERGIIDGRNQQEESARDMPYPNSAVGTLLLYMAQLTIFYAFIIFTSLFHVASVRRKYPSFRIVQTVAGLSLREKGSRSIHYRN